jgi:arylsulfatase A-like enzyme
VVLPQVLGADGYLTMMVCDCPHILENGYHYDRGFDAFEWIRGQESDGWKPYPEAPAFECDAVKIRNPERLRTHHQRNIAWWEHESDTFVARTMTEACRWLEKAYAREKFFLYVDTFDPHEPWDAPQWFVEMYDPGYEGQVVRYPLYAPCDFLTDAELKHVRALYAAEVTLVDRWVGRLLEKIDDLGLLTNTMVLLTTDHGFLHGEHGIMGKSLISANRVQYVPLYEEIAHIPLVIHAPGCTAGARDAVVQPMDFMPTILDLAEVAQPDTVHGKSFAKLLRGRRGQHRDFAVSSPYMGGEAVPCTVTSGQWSAVFWSAPKEGQFVDRAVDGLAKVQDAVAGGEDLLFDLSRDSAQQRNVAGEHPEVMADLRGKLLEFCRGVGCDPKTQGRWEQRP